VADIQASNKSLSHQESDNPLLSCAIKLPEFKERIVTGWQRFSSGLWRVPKGDIYGAYCADQFPKLKTFVEGGHNNKQVLLCVAPHQRQHMCVKNAFRTRPF